MKSKVDEIIGRFEKSFRNYEIEKGSQDFIYRIESKDGNIAYVVDCIFKILNEAKGKIPYNHKKFWYKVFGVEA
ncbi:MAG: hypothetical protein QXP77_03455 [Candidatus Aenigmatarchaeota archaeon]